MTKRFEVTICDDGQCSVLGEFRDEGKAKARAAKEAKKRAKRHLKEKVPTGRVHAEVRGVENGMYDTSPSYEVEFGGGAPKPRGRARARRAVAPVPDAGEE